MEYISSLSFTQTFKLFLNKYDMQKKAEASVIMDLDIFSSVSSKNTKVVEFINYQNSYDCSLFFVKFIFLYLLRMGGLCLNPS